MLKLSMIPDESCQGCCRLRLDRSVTTAMFYTPIYDKHGNNVNQDGNITMNTVTCITCDRNWLAKTQHGNTEFTEIKENGNV